MLYKAEKEEGCMNNTGWTMGGGQGSGAGSGERKRTWYATLKDDGILPSRLRAISQPLIQDLVIREFALAIQDISAIPT